MSNKLAIAIFLSSVVLLNSQAFSAVPFNIVKPSNKIGEGRCYMDECSYSKIIAAKVIKRTAQETRVRATLLGGTSYHKNGNYPKAIPKNIKWNKTSHQITAVCSYRNPALVYGNQVDDLDFSSIPGVLESPANLYFQLCHNSYDGYYLDAVKFGYVVY